MLSCIRRPTISYSLATLAEDSCVAVGRETDAHIQLDSLDIPCLLSRKHANLVLQPEGTVTLTDLGSTNGTFAARSGQPLRKLPPGYAWELQHGDTVGFGGPETIIVKRCQVGNPFLFVYYSTPAASEAPLPTQPVCMDVADNTPKSGRHCASDQFRGQPFANQTLARARRAQDEPMPDSCTTRDQLPQPNVLSSRSPHSARAGHFKDAWSQSQCTPRNHKKATETVHNHLTCPICCDTLLATHILHCGHMFCGTCLATWMTQNQSCPSCRKVISGVPVRCFTVDNMISDLLNVQHMSPGVRTDRKRKQEHWDHIHRLVMHDWVTLIQRRRETALQGAARNNQELQAHAPAAAAARGGADAGGRHHNTTGSLAHGGARGGAVVVPVAPSVDSDATARFGAAGMNTTAV